MLKMTGVKLENISDTGIYLFIEKGLRGEISYVSERFIKTNNKDVKNQDPAKPSKHIIHIDEKNLCRWGMSGYLP